MSIKIIHDENENEETPFTRFLLPLRDALQAAIDSTDEEKVLELPDGVSIRIESRGAAERGSIHVNLVDALSDLERSGNEVTAGCNIHGCCWLLRRSGQWESSAPKLRIDGASYGSEKRNYGWPKIGSSLSPKAYARVIELVSGEAQNIAGKRQNALRLDDRLVALMTWRPAEGKLIDLAPYEAAATAHYRIVWGGNVREHSGAPEPMAADQSLSIGFKETGSAGAGSTRITLVSEDGSGYRATLVAPQISLDQAILVAVERPRLHTAAHYDTTLQYGFSDPAQLDLIPELHAAFVALYSVLRAAKDAEDALSDLFLPPGHAG